MLPRFSILHLIVDPGSGPNPTPTDALIDLSFPERTSTIAVQGRPNITSAKAVAANDDERVVTWLERQVDSGGATTAFKAFAARTQNASLGTWCGPEPIGVDLSPLGSCEKPPRLVEIRASTGELIVFFRDIGIVAASYAPFPAADATCSSVWTTVNTSVSSETISSPSDVPGSGLRTLVAAELTPGAVLVVWVETVNGPRLGWAKLIRSPQTGSWSFSNVATQAIDQEIALADLVRTEAGVMVLVATTKPDAVNTGVPYARTFAEVADAWSAPAIVDAAKFTGTHPTKDGNNCDDSRTSSPITATAGADQNSVVAVWSGAEKGNLVTTLWAFEVRATAFSPPVVLSTVDLFNPTMALPSGFVVDKTVSLASDTEDDGTIRVGFSLATSNQFSLERIGRPYVAQRDPTAGDWSLHDLDTGGDAIILRLSAQHGTGQRIVVWTETDDLDETVVSTFE